MRRVLICHHLLLGDVLALTPLVAKLRFHYPHAEIALTVDRAQASIYQKRPFGVIPLVFDPEDLSTLAPIFEGDGYDLAIVPGDNRFSWLALAAGARWILAFAGDRPAYKSWPIDEQQPYPDQPAAWADMVAELVPGLSPPPFRPTDWPDPNCELFEMPSATRYGVLHVGASTMLKLWEPAKWAALAEYLESQSITPVLLCGRGEEGIIARIDTEEQYRRYAGTLRLEQVWRLLRGARLLVAPDTGIAHLGRVVGVPTVALFGPGSPTLSGAGSYWRTSPYRAVTVPDFPCRDQSLLFKRKVDWVRRCARGTKECTVPRCMQSIDVAMVRHAVDSLVASTRTDALAALRGPFPSMPPPSP